MTKIYNWEIEKAATQTSERLKDWIFMAVACGQPIPGCISVEACRYVLRKRGEDGKGYHNT